MLHKRVLGGEDKVICVHVHPKEKLGSNGAKTGSHTHKVVTKDVQKFSSLSTTHAQYYFLHSPNQVKWSSRYHHVYVSSKPHHTRNSTQLSIMTLHVKIPCNDHCKNHFDNSTSHNEILRVHTRLMQLKFPCWTRIKYCSIRLILSHWYWSQRHSSV